MALNDVVFIKGAGGLGRPLAGEDHISGMVFWLTDANLPSGYSTTDRVKALFSIDDAQAQGITQGSATNGVLWYHINEFFKAAPQGVLYAGIYGGVTATVAYTDIELVQNFADGKIRQMGVFDTTTFATGSVTALQASCTALEAAHKPTQVIYGADFSAATIGALSDLRTLNSKDVSVTIGEDGGATGAALAVSEGYSITDLGSALGQVAFAKVNESTEWIEKFQVDDGAEFNVPAFATGNLVNSQADALLATLKTNGYMFIRKHVGLAGTYQENSATAITTSNDFATIENGRTMNKAVRNIRTFMLPNIASPVLVNANGQLTEGTVAKFKNDTARALEQMQRDEEISAFEVIVNPLQDILSTSEITITVKIVPVGIARQIKINIGFTVSIA
jgi:hypothetical protein